MALYDDNWKKTNKQIKLFFFSLFYEILIKNQKFLM